MQNWFNSWTPQQRNFHKNMASAMLDEVNEITEKVLDSCYIAAMIEKLDITLEQCGEIAKQANLYMVEVKEIINKDGELYFKMLNDEKLRSQIKKEIKTLIGEKKLMSAEVPNLKQKYTKASIKDLTILWAESKEEIKADKELKEVIKKHQPKQEIPKISNGELKATLANEGEHGLEIPYTVTEKEIEQGRYIDVKDVVKELGVEKAEFINPNKPQLKIMSMNIEGKYGIYTKGINGVSTAGKTFKDIEELKDYSESIEKEYKTKKEELYNKINELNKEMHEIGEKRNKDFEFLAEIQEVFNM